MTYRDMTAAELVEELERRDEIARSDHFHDMQARCYDDPDFDLAYEQGQRERCNVSSLPFGGMV